MAATISAVYMDVVSQLAAALAVPVVQGFPVWARNTATVPCAAVELFAWQPGAPTRVGQRTARQSVQFRLWLFARHEPELATLLQRCAIWAAEQGSCQVDGSRIDLRLGDGARHEPQTDMQEEAHAMWLLLNATWSVEV